MRPKGNGCAVAETDVEEAFLDTQPSPPGFTQREKGGNIQRAAAPWQRTARCGQRGMGRPGRLVGDDGRARVSQVNAGCCN